MECDHGCTVAQRSEARAKKKAGLAMAKLFHTLDISVSYAERVYCPCLTCQCCVPHDTGEFRLACAYRVPRAQFAEDEIDVCDLPELSQEEIAERLPALGPMKRLMR